MGMLIKIDRKFKHFRSNMQVSAQNIADIYVWKPPTGTSLNQLRIIAGADAECDDRAVG